jgi:hypothetical protein
MLTRPLLLIVSLGILSTVTGCYDEPSRYDHRPSYQGSEQPTSRESLMEQEREYRRQRRAQERAYRAQERESRPDWLR